MCNRLIQETHPKTVLVFKRWPYYIIQQNLMHGSVNGNDAFSVYRSVNMYMYMHMCAIWGIYVDINVHERKCFILEDLQHSALFLFCTPKTICFVWLILGHISHFGCKPPLPGFIYFMYISSTTSVLYLSPLYMNCMSLANKHCFIVIVIVKGVACNNLWKLFNDGNKMQYPQRMYLKGFKKMITPDIGGFKLIYSRNRYMIQDINTFAIVHIADYLLCENMLGRPLNCQTHWPGSIKLPTCAIASTIPAATMATNSSVNLKFVWLNPRWWYWVLTMLQDQNYWGPNINSHQLLLRF